MGRRAGEKTDGKAFRSVCELLNIKAGDSERVLDISTRAFHRYRGDDAAITDATMALLIRRMLARAGAVGKVTQVTGLLRRMIAPSWEKMPVSRAELGAGAGPAAYRRPVASRRRRGKNALESAFALARQGRAEEADALFEQAEHQGESAVDIWIGRGHNWFDVGEPDQALPHFERALDARPDDVPLAICVAKSHLGARTGSAPDHWNRATAMITAHLARPDLPAPLRNLWRVWEAVAVSRNPVRFGDPTAFGQTAVMLGDLLDQAARDRDTLAEFHCRSLLGPALFQSGTADGIAQGIRCQARFVRSLNSAVLTFARGVALKRLANMHLFKAAHDTDPQASRLNLKTAVVRYERAARCFKVDVHPVEWALVKYSQASACMNLGAWYQAHGSGTSANRLARDYFDAAETASLAALDRLPREKCPDDWGRAAFNVAVCHHHRPAESDARRIEHLHKAVEYYRLSMVVFHRDHIPAEWRGTLLPLAQAYQDLARLTQDPAHTDAAESCLSEAATVAA